MSARNPSRSANAAPLAPAQAGSVGIHITPQGRDAEVLRHGLNIYSFLKNQRGRNDARVDQRGTGNGAAISQTGTGNRATVFQRGKGHTGTITQNGNNNTYGVFQFGRNTSAAATQNGNGKTGFSFIGGW